MSGLQLSGLASGFDWKTFVDTIMNLERAPATKLETEKTANLSRITALDGLNTRLADLRTAVAGLSATEAFTTRSAASSNSSSNATAAAGMVTGVQSFNVTRLATPARLLGNANIGKAIAPTSVVSGVTLAALGTSATPTAGFFTVNGARVTIDPADSLQDVFARISTATGGTVTASYDPALDHIALASSAGPISLGAANDTSNFLAVARLNANGTAAVASSAALGTLNPVATLSSARLAGSVTAVDGAGAGTFSINGVAIDYNLNSDSLNAVVARINASGAGVTAAYDPVADRFSLLNKATGSLGITVSEGAGGLLGALGLTTAAGAALVAGTDAQFTVNNGPVLTSASNTLGAAQHGLEGLTLTVGATGAQTVTVAADTTGMRSKIDSFVAKFNAVQTYLDDQTKVTSVNGKVSTSILSSNREVQRWGTSLRAAAFAAVPGLDAGISRLESLGIDFSSGSSLLVVKDETKLVNAINNTPSQVAAFFQQSATGFAARFTAITNGYLGVNGATGELGAQRGNIVNTNTSLDQQIADIDRRLVERRSTLEAGFIAMETAQAKLTQMQTQLTNAFPTTSS
ncbi:MAG: flagellar filament capping protein FliD [Opitutaceae bacterium]|jgi:flagellar hook-associated protein 2